MARHQAYDLAQMQSLPLHTKVQMTKERIQAWYESWKKWGIYDKETKTTRYVTALEEPDESTLKDTEYVNSVEDGQVYVSFSGGKDSTVLLDIARKMYPDIKAMFVDVPTQYPELRDFAKTFDNVDIICPKKNFMQVCEQYGFPLISKEVSECVYGARKYLTRVLEEESVKQASKQASKHHTHIDTDNLLEQENTVNFQNPLVNIQKQTNAQKLILLGGGTIQSIESSEDLANIPQRMAIMLVVFDEWYKARKGNIPREDGSRSIFSQEKYKFFLEAPFEISNQCCNVMKKEPAHRYNKETGLMPITAQMASESRLRMQKWMQNGCNAFETKNPISNPMSFWTEQDVLLYIKENNLPICSVYGEVVKDYDAMGQCDGQISFAEIEEACELEIFELEKPILKTTGCSRTGCMLCGFGCHLEKGPSRFEMLKETHPKMYDLLDVVKNNDVTMREAIEWTNKNGNLNIRL